ncbi:MAG: TonB-dependent receptor [Sphingomicrobium sp.]|nr:TonB-dependent receptor [Sphingomonadales bacterium]
MTRFDTHLLRAALLTSAALATPAMAQDKAPPPSPPAPQATEAAPAASPPAGVGAQAAGPTSAGDTIIVTGTSVRRAGFNTPLAVTTLGEGALARLTATSQADILNSIPTIKADAGGGEVAANVFVRGLPSGGQYQFTPLMYDGIPVLSTFGLNSSAYDVYYRNDLGLDRLEFVRGGVSNLFGPGSVAGLINYISKTGGDTQGGVIQLEAAERGRYRGDAAISGPLGGNLYYALSGFYRRDDGPIRTGLDTKGYQVRGNLKYRFNDGSGSVTLFGQWINDQAQFYLPIPLDGMTRNRIRGNDGEIVNSVQTPAVAGIGYNTPNGRFQTDITDGVKTRGGQVALAFNKKFGGGWGINGRAKYSQYKHRFGLWSDGDGIVNVPETLASFISNPARRTSIPELNGITLANASFTFANDGSTVPATYLLFANRFTDRDRPVHDFTAELNLTKEFATGGASHTVTLGGFYGNATARDVNVTTRILAEFNNQPRLINLTVRNPTTGAVTVISQGGVLDASVANYVNNRARAKRYAGYAADQIDAGRFLFDIGARVEHFAGDIRRERVSTFVTDTTTPNLSRALRDVSYGNGAFLSGSVGTTEWAIAAGALYKLTPRLNLYANASRGYFFPEIRAVQFTPPLPTPVTVGGSPGTQSYTGEIIKQAEVGVKYHAPGVTATLAGLYTNLKNRRQVNFLNAPGGGFTEQVNLVATESYGLEATASIRLIGALRFDGNLTLQHHEYTQFMANGTTSAFVGNELERQPNILYNAGLYYDDGRFDASLFTNYTGNDFTAANNAIKLKGFNVVNLDAGYKIRLGNSAARIGVNVFNLFDTDAVTEGSPRLDVNQTSGGAYFVGRPVLPRRITGRVTFNF